MMDMQELEITIDIEGKVEVKVRGMHGRECVKTQKILRMLLVTFKNGPYRRLRIGDYRKNL